MHSRSYKAHLLINKFHQTYEVKDLESLIKYLIVNLEFDELPTYLIAAVTSFPELEAFHNLMDKSDGGFKVAYDRVWAFRNQMIKPSPGSEKGYRPAIDTIANRVRLPSDKKPDIISDRQNPSTGLDRPQWRQQRKSEDLQDKKLKGQKFSFNDSSRNKLALSKSGFSLDSGMQADCASLLQSPLLHLIARDAREEQGFELRISTMAGLLCLLLMVIKLLIAGN